MRWKPFQKKKYYNVTFKEAKEKKNKWYKKCKQYGSTTQQQQQQCNMNSGGMNMNHKCLSLSRSLAPFMWRRFCDVDPTKLTRKKTTQQNVCDQKEQNVKFIIAIYIAARSPPPPTTTKTQKIYTNL